MKLPSLALRGAHRPISHPSGRGTPPCLHAGHRTVAQAAPPDRMHQQQQKHQEQREDLGHPNLNRRALLLSVALGSTLLTNNSAPAYASDSPVTSSLSSSSPVSPSARATSSSTGSPSPAALISESPSRDAVTKTDSGKSPAPLDQDEISDEAAKKMLAEEEKRKKRKKSKGRIRELQEIRAELAEKEERLLEKEQKLLQKEETLSVLKEQLELERKIRALLTKAKEKAEEEATLAMGLCTGVSLLP